MLFRDDQDAPFGEPVNINDVSLLPVNTEAFEVYPTISRAWPARGAELYFESYRNGSLHIWRAVWEAVPEPSFSVVGPDAGGKVTVDASASSTPEGTEPLTFAWDFGDGTTGEWSTAGAWEAYSHTYAAPGRFQIKLTAANSLGVENTATGVATIGCGPPGDVSPWTAADVGTPLFPGSSWKDAEDVLVCAGGCGFVGSADEYHLVHRTLAGDFALEARVSDVMGWGAGASLGLMARESLEPGAPYAAIFLGSPAPPEPFAACGPDPTGDDLGCGGFVACP